LEIIVLMKPCLAGWDCVNGAVWQLLSQDC